MKISYELIFFKNGIYNLVGAAYVECTDNFQDKDINAISNIKNNTICSEDILNLENTNLPKSQLKSLNLKSSKKNYTKKVVTSELLNHLEYFRDIWRNKKKGYLINNKYFVSEATLNIAGIDINNIDKYCRCESISPILVYNNETGLDHYRKDFIDNRLDIPKLILEDTYLFYLYNNLPKLSQETIDKVLALLKSEDPEMNLLGLTQCCANLENCLFDIFLIFRDKDSWPPKCHNSIYRYLKQILQIPRGRWHSYSCRRIYKLCNDDQRLKMWEWSAREHYASEDEIKRHLSKVVLRDGLPMSLYDENGKTVDVY